ncbi:hypothetical protein HMPREF0578_1788 [Mobiluncus mulieris 28-1]|nr:hypothetical protein HMPREF0578_1788 [Mobiluncus mulieris 28-1]
MRIRVPQALARPVRGKIGKFWGCVRRFVANSGEFEVGWPI